MLAEIPPRHPRDEFRRLKSEAAQRNVSTKRFKQMALDFLDSLAADPDFPIRSSTYNNHKGRLEKHLATLHDLYPAQITASEVFNIIQPLRIAGRRSTAHNCRKLIERVIEWAQGHGAFPKNEFNPAELSVGSPLHQLLRTKTTDPKPFSKPHKALHFSKTPALFARLQNIKRRTRFTLPEASRATNKGREYLYNLIRCGRLKATKPNTPYSSRSMDNWEVEPEDLFKVLRKEREVVPGLPSVALFALLFQILTASRPNESLGARWEEWKEEAAVLVVPWQRIKNGGRERKDFHVPLSPPATEILTMLREQQKRDEIWGTTPFVFGNYPSNNPTSGRIGIPPCLQTLRNLLGNNVENVDVDVTLHGFRTGFGSWGRRLGFLEHNVERALKHERGFGETYVARLYSRDAFNDLDGDPEILAAFGDDPLRGLLEAWAIYCVTGELPDIHKPAPVVPLIQRRANQRRL
jgi:integrase